MARRSRSPPSAPTAPTPTAAGRTRSSFSSPEEDAAAPRLHHQRHVLRPGDGANCIDYVGGRADLDAKILRAIGDPAARFTEDKLRILRAVRIAARFELAIDPATLAAAKQMAPRDSRRLAGADRGGVAEAALAPQPRRAVRLLREFDLIEPILPELSGKGIEAWEQTVRVIENLPREASFPLAFAAILLALGKSAVEGIADRLRLSGAEKGRIVWLVELRGALSERRVPATQPIEAHPGAPRQPRIAGPARAERWLAAAVLA